MNGLGGNAEMRIYLNEMPCFKKGDNTKIDKYKNHYYDLDILQNDGLKAQLKSYILDRGNRLSLKTMDDEIYKYVRLSHFINEECQKISNFRQMEISVFLKKYKAWHLKNGLVLTRKHFNRLTGKDDICESDYIKYVRQLYQYLEPEDQRPEKEKDIWNLENLGFEIRQNPIDIRKTINFSGIKQTQIRQETKQICWSLLKSKALNSVVAQIRFVKKLSLYLQEKHPEVKSLGEMNRQIVEEYITYRNTENPNGALVSDISYLSSILQLAGKLLEKPELGELLIKRDFPKTTKPLFRYYSDEELKRLNTAIIQNMDRQTACIWILHQLVGGRSSDIYTLRPDCLYNEHGQNILRIYQVKTSYFEKPITNDAAELIRTCIEETYEQFGDTQYIFVDKNNPKRVVQRRGLQKRLSIMVNQNNILGDDGVLITCSTLMLRHTYGVKLVDLHLDDATIAQLLGHKGVSSVHHYRRASGQLLINETEDLRKTMDKILSKIIKEWEGYEQIFQNG